MAQKLSKGFPLDFVFATENIDAEHPECDADADYYNIEQFAKMTGKHRERWQDVSISTWAINALDNAFLKSLPLLELLEVEDPNPYSEALPFGGGPRLRRFSIRRVLVQWNVPNLSQLENIFVRNILQVAMTNLLPCDVFGGTGS